MSGGCRLSTTTGGGGLAEDRRGGAEDGRSVPGDAGRDAAGGDGEAEGEECEVSHLQTRQSGGTVSSGQSGALSLVQVRPDTVL